MSPNDTPEDPQPLQLVAGHEEHFFAFWPDYAPGLKWTELRLLTFQLHREEITEFPCTMYGCRTFLDYTLTSDDDWRVLE